MPSLWKGSINFALVSVPVSLQSAVTDGNAIHFNEVCPEHRCKAKRGPSVCTTHNHPVSQVAKGYPVTDGQFLIMNPADFDAVKVPSSHVMDVQEFVALDAIDPRYFEKPYWLVPESGGESAYALIVEALRQTRLVGLGMVTMRGRTNWMALRAFDDATHLALYTLRFESELLPETQLPAVRPVEVKPQLVDLAVQLVRAQHTEFDPSKYHDEYQARLRQVIDAKVAGRSEVEVAVPVVRETTADTIEQVLLASLQRSLGRTS